jgi:hypothetical protein
MEEQPKFIMNKKRFQGMVEETVKIKRVNYLDAILILCEENHIDVEDVKKYISPIIKDKLEADALRLNFISGGHSYLPLDC